MRSVDRRRKRCERTQLAVLDPTRERRAGQARRAAVRQLIAAHPDEYQRLLKAEQRRRLQVVGAGSGGDPDAA